MQLIANNSCKNHLDKQQRGKLDLVVDEDQQQAI